MESLSDAMPRTLPSFRSKVSMTDGQLLARFVATQEAAAFEELVRRHGPMVLRVCQRVLHHSQDAEDAFQAAFLVLLRKAGTVAKQESVASWLYGVAYRVALKAKARASQRHLREKSGSETVFDDIREAPVAGELATQDARHVLDEELSRLPEKYRSAVVLCLLEGKTSEQAAEQLHCQISAVKMRLLRAREVLRDRLARRGLAISVGGVALLLTQEAGAAVAATLAKATVGSAALVAGGKAAAFSTNASILADATLKTMTAVKLKVAGIATLAATAVVATAAAIAVLRPDSGSPVMMLANFDGASVPVNKAGEPFPSYYFDPQDTSDSGGIFTSSIETKDAIKGNSLRLKLTQGQLKAQFNPYGKDRWTFARDYVADPAAWHFNTYNRLTFWIKLPTPIEERAYRSNGEASVTVGTYCKRITDAHPGNDEVGGGHWYHRVNVPATGHWAQVVLNTHPHFGNVGNSGADVAMLEHPTGESRYNYFDTLTRFYISVRSPPAKYPADYLIDEIRFERQPKPESDTQVFSIAATHVAETNRVIVTWSRPKGEDSVKHEVRYAFQDVHKIGWDQAQPAPGGLIAPAGTGTANGMVFDTTELPLAGQSVVYIAIKPQNARLFSQVAVPLTLK
jgi:RNA polymerase sigma factor (sigma-70 family)